MATAARRGPALPTERRLDAARKVGDPPADALVAELSTRGGPFAVNALLARVRKNDDPLPRALPAPLRDFLDATAVVPAWATPPLLRRAAAWSERHCFDVVTALFCAALPMAYASAKGALVLEATGRLRHDLDRRINETGRFVFDVLAPGAFGASGRGIRSAQKVRLLHAAVRVHLCRHAPAVVAAAEVPINQEDMAGTIFGFSVVTLRAVARLAGPSAREDEEAFYALWRLVGVLLGVDPALLPARLDDAEHLAERIADRTLAPSAHGRKLAAALVQAMDRHMPVAALRGMPGRLMAHLLGPEIGQMLGLPTGGHAAGRRASPGRAVLERLPRALHRVAPYVGRHLLEAWMRHELAGRVPTFRMPAGLRERWDLTSV